MRDHLMGLAMLAALALYGLCYWAMQPTCGDGEVRIRGTFMTACVVGH